MSKKLSMLTIEDMRKQMSIAGSPDKIVKLMTDINELIGKTIDETNPAELINTAFALDRIKAEIKRMTRRLEKITGQAYIIK